MKITDEMVEDALIDWFGDNWGKKSKAWRDMHRTEMRSTLQAAFKSIAHPVKVPDEIYVALDECRADLNYLFGRVAADGSFAQAAADSLRHKLDKVAAFIYSINEKTP